MGTLWFHWSILQLLELFLLKPWHLPQSWQWHHINTWAKIIQSLSNKFVVNATWNTKTFWIWFLWWKLHLIGSTTSYVDLQMGYLSPRLDIISIIKSIKLSPTANKKLQSQKWLPREISFLDSYEIKVVGRDDVFNLSLCLFLEKYIGQRWERNEFRSDGDFLLFGVREKLERENISKRVTSSVRLLKPSL